MSKHKTRKNKTCQNCERFVHQNFCSHCGQENTEVRHSFIYLVKHFISDLLHYDSSIWSTTKLLLFSPATLSKEYIGGKRKKYVDPIKLYIFISFIAFFIPGILPEEAHGEKDSKINIMQVDNVNFPVESIDKITGQITTDTINSYAELDSLANIKNVTSKEYYLTRFLLKARENSKADQQEKIREFILHNLPKVLFLYMPLFAFWLWLFHNKKKFWYFDSAIFTLHYFSFLLLSITILILLNTVFKWMGVDDTIESIVQFILFLYAIFYFFRANRLFYGEKRWISNTKASVIFVIDTLLIFVIFILFALLAVFMV